jgi:predicted DNA-binding protein
MQYNVKSKKPSRSDRTHDLSNGRISLRLSIEEMARIDEVAKRQSRTRSNLIRVLLNRALSLKEFRK